MYYTIHNTKGFNGPLWAARYSSLYGAADAIADCMAWNRRVIGAPERVGDEGARSFYVYECAEDRQNDETGNGPRVIEHLEQRDLPELEENELYVYCEEWIPPDAEPRGEWRRTTRRPMKLSAAREEALELQGEGITVRLVDIEGFEVPCLT